MIEHYLIKYVLFFLLHFSPSASLRSELNHIHASAIEHLRQNHQQESAVAKVELEKTLENNRIQVGHLVHLWIICWGDVNINKINPATVMVDFFEYYIT